MGVLPYFFAIASACFDSTPKEPGVYQFIAVSRVNLWLFGCLQRQRRWERTTGHRQKPKMATVLFIFFFSLFLGQISQELSTRPGRRSTRCKWLLSGCASTQQDTNKSSPSDFFNFSIYVLETSSNVRGFLAESCSYWSSFAWIFFANFAAIWGRAGLLCASSQLPWSSGLRITANYIKLQVLVAKTCRRFQFGRGCWKFSGHFDSQWTLWVCLSEPLRWHPAQDSVLSLNRPASNMLIRLISRTSTLLWLFSDLFWHFMCSKGQILQRSFRCINPCGPCSDSGLRGPAWTAHVHPLHARPPWRRLRVR